jgi:hypothetical protein
MIRQSNRVKSKLNALKHGFYGKFGLLPWEKTEDFEAMREKILSSLRPWDPILEKIADEIVMMEWLLLRNQRSSLLYALCEPFGRAVEKHRNDDDWTAVASKLINQRDAGILPIAKASQIIIKSHSNPKQSRRLEKLGKIIASGINRVAHQYELTSEYFLGLDDQTMKQAERAMELQSHLQKMRAQYFDLEQWLVTRNKLVPQLEVKPASDTDAEVDDLMADDEEPLVRRIAKDHRDDAESGKSV